MIDLSDGVASDALRMAEESGVERATTARDDVWYKPYDHGSDYLKHARDYLAWEVALIEQTVAFFHVRGDRARNRPFVKRVAAALANQVERGGQLRIREDFTGLRRMSVWKESCRRHRIGGQLPLTALPLTADNLGHGIAAARIVDIRESSDDRSQATPRRR